MDDQKFAVAQAWGQYLHRFPWEWYGHLTFRRNISVERALHTFRFWHHRLNRKQFGARYTKRGHQGVRFVRGVEWQRRGAPHFHFLAMDCSNLSIEEAEADWLRLAGDALIQPFDRGKGGAFYIAKVYSADGRGDLDFGGQWPDFQTLSRVHARVGFGLSRLGRTAQSVGE